MFRAERARLRQEGVPVNHSILMVLTDGGASDEAEFDAAKVDLNRAEREERLKVYHDQTEPIVGYYEERGVLKRFDGTRNPTEVHDHLRAGRPRRAPLPEQADAGVGDLGGSGRVPGEQRRHRLAPLRRVGEDQRAAGGVRLLGGDPAP